MKAREIIEGAIYDPADFQTIGKAFDDAWAQLEPDVGTSRQAIEAARIKLANVVLSVATNGITSPGEMTESALKLMFADPTEL